MGLRLAHVAVALSSLSLAACGLFFEPAPDVANPKTAKAPGLTLSYPGNWSTSTEAQTVEDITISTLTIESSGSALAMLQVYDAALPLVPDEVFATFMEGVTEASGEQMGGIADVEAGGSVSIEHTVMGETWRGRKGTFSVKLLGETVPATLETLVHEVDGHSVVLVMQAPTEDWAKAEPGFRLIEETLAVDK